MPYAAMTSCNGGQQDRDYANLLNSQSDTSNSKSGAQTY
jgi:hypothetical protein